MAKVFISYSVHDRDAANIVFDAVRDAGFEISTPEMVTPEILTPGEAVEVGVRRHMASAQCVVVLWSSAAMKSEWVQFELGEAVRAWTSDRLVLASLDDTPLPIGLRDLSVISFRPGSGSATKQLIERIRMAIGRQQSTDEAAFIAFLEQSRFGASPAAAREPSLACEASPRGSRSIAVLLLVAVVAIIIGAVGYMNLPSSPNTLPSLPKASPDTLEPLADFISVLGLFGVLILGVAIGAGALWILSRRRRPVPAAQPLQSAAMLTNAGHEVFVSYSGQDASTVEDLVKLIEQMGYAVWIDRQRTSSGRYAAPIVRAIRQSRLVALMCSQNAFQSDHVTREVYVAGDFKKPFLLIQLDPTEFPDDLHYFVTGFPRIPLPVSTQKLSAELAKLIVPH